MSILNPTEVNYSAYQEAYDFFNAELFGGTLPNCLITFQRKAKSYGYFARERFGTRGSDSVTDEIALNPKYFQGRSDGEVLSTLVHEMVHLQQFHFGDSPRGAYHDKQWAAMMEAVGLVPSDTGQPGGKRTGQKVSHYIQPGGGFERAFTRLVKKHKWARPYDDIWQDANAKAKRDSKSKFSCPGCGINAWGKPDIKIACVDCGEVMISLENVELSGPIPAAA